MLSSLFLGAKTGNLFFVIIFLPVPLYFIFSFFKKLRKKNIYENDKANPINFTIGLVLFAFLLSFGVYNVFFVKKAISPIAQDAPKPILQISKQKNNTTLPKEITIKTDIPGSTINIRETASSSAAVLEKGQDGETFKVISQIEDWYSVSLENGKTGWIRKELTK